MLGDTRWCNHTEIAHHRHRSLKKPISILAMAAGGILSYGIARGALAGGPSAHDPGVRTGTASAGGPIAGLSSDEMAFFNSGQSTFEEIEQISDGLGPRFNLNQCSGCHAQPAIGGTSPPVNPQPGVGLAGGANNAVPVFITPNGPIREARFKLNPDGTPDGGVHSLFVISGRVDSSGSAKGCAITQDAFNTQFAKGNVSLRIPTPVFGAGLIEAIPDNAIFANLAANRPAKQWFGIKGHVNRISGFANTSGNTGTITRFGWKAQNPSLLVFAGEAYNVEMGISNENFPSERETAINCQFAPVPNDTTTTSGPSDTEEFALFMRFLAPPVPSTTVPGGAASIAHGRAVFGSTGCSLCHTPSLQTVASAASPALSNQTANLFSDLALHDMGAGLADGISQGAASGSEFRTAPLWGLGQRLFFLHDGRTNDLVRAIYAHSSAGHSQYAPSEANQAIAAFNALPDSAKQDLLNFLRSL